MSNTTKNEALDYALNRNIQTAPAPKILFWDIETAPMLVEVFSLKPRYIPFENIVEDWFMLCAAWKWLGDDRVYSQRIKAPHEDRALTKKLLNVVAGADIVVAHNGDAFDTKKLNARGIFHGLPMIPDIPSVDTLKAARKRFKFSSNRLDYLAQHLGVGKKQETSRGLWHRARKCEPKAMKEMQEYNREDVRVLERVYLKLRSSMTNHPNVGLLHDDPHFRCPNCGSTNVIRLKKPYRTRTRRYQRYKCAECGASPRANKVSLEGGAMLT